MRVSPWILLVLVVLAPSTAAGETVDLEAVARIKLEGLEHSEVVSTLLALTDEAGPRLTGSPGLRRAAEWSRLKLEEWGLAHARLEPWGEFGRGWSVDRFYIALREPWYLPLIAYPQAWTPGTPGPVSAPVVAVTIEQEEQFAQYRGRLQGTIVLARKPPEIELFGELKAVRLDEASLKELVEAPVARPADRSRRREANRAAREFREKVYRFFSEEGVRMVLEPSRGEHGTVIVGGGGSWETDSPAVLPRVSVTAEHYALLHRLAEQGKPVRLEADIQTAFHSEDLQGYNVLAEIPGSDPSLGDQVVMLGAHLDSWHAAAGATDNAAGCAVVLEAVRILRKAGLKPRRTILIALWSGEEQGLLGSKAFVRRQFGDPDSRSFTTAYDRFSAYFNLDNGTGRIRGIYLQNNDAVRPVFEAWLAPFHDLGADTVSIRATGGTDHLSFSAIGLPAFQFIQDPIAYGTLTHHSNMDLSDHVIEADLMQASVIMAAFVYHTAMREQILPRRPWPEAAAETGPEVEKEPGEQPE